MEDTEAKKHYRIKKGNIIGLFIVILIICAAAWYLARPAPAPGPGTVQVPNALGWPSSEEVPIAATVNGEPIYTADIERQFARVPELYRDSVTPGMLLNQTITETIIAQEAREMNIVISDEDVDENINSTLYEQGVSEAILMSQLEEQNYTLPEFRDEVKKQMVIVRFVNETVLSKLDVTDDEITEYYNQSSYPELNISLADIQDNIKEALLTEKARPMFAAYLEVLMRQSNITRFLD